MISKTEKFDKKTNIVIQRTDFKINKRLNLDGFEM